MWRLLRWLLRPTEPPRIIYRQVDFTQYNKTKWASYDYGDNYDTRFTIRGFVQRGDEILIVLRSGRIGRYRLFSVTPDFTGIGDYKVRATAIGYYRKAPVRVLSIPLLPAPKIKALLTDGSRGIRSSNSQLSDLQGGSLITASEQWKILVRNEASRARASEMCSASYM
jgi:hypothetical protein